MAEGRGARRVSGVLLVLALLEPVAMPVAQRAAATTSRPWLSVGGVRIMEPFQGRPDAVAHVPVVLGHPAPSDVTFRWSIEAGSAGPSDVVMADGSGLIPAGGQSTSIPVSVRGDGSYELEERAVVEVTAVSGATVRSSNGFVRVREAVFDPAPDGVVMGDLTIPEPDRGSVQGLVPVVLPATRRYDVTVSWVVRSQYGARAGVDLEAGQGTVTIVGNTTSASFPVEVNGDAEPEPKETALIEGLDASGKQDDIVVRDPWGSVTLPKSDAAGDPLPWRAPRSVRSGPPTTVYFESDLGDWVGQGKRLHDTLATSGIRVAESDHEFRMAIDGDSDTTLRLFTGKLGRPLRKGIWRRLPWIAPGKPWLNVSHGAGGCSNSRSTLVVQSVKRSDRGALKRFALRLEQFCDGDDEPLRLFARFKRGDTTMPPPPGDPEDMAWHAPSGAVPSSGDYLYLESRPGDWVGQGETYLLPIDESTRVDPVRREVDVRFAGSPGNWNLLTGVPDWRKKWSRGLYPAADGAVANPVKARLSVTAYSRGCNAFTGQLAVDSRDFDDQGRLTSLQLRFEQRCDFGPPLFGQLRWSRS